MNLPQLPQDKANHALYGAMVALFFKQLAVTAVLFGFDLHGYRPKDIGLAVSAAFALGKEGIDALVNYRTTGNWRGVPVNSPHGVEALDALATFSGGFMVWAAST